MKKSFYKLNMKYILTIILLLFFFNSVQAKSISDIRVKFVSFDKIGQTCNSIFALGCYISPPVNEVLLSTDLRGELLLQVFFHEIGHFYLNDKDLSPYLSNNQTSEDIMNIFSDWILGKKIDKDLELFFINSIKN